MLEGVSVTTMKDIAELAGVSTSAVSKILNGRPSYISEQTRARVLEIVQELNYQPSRIARALSQQRSGSIGLIVPDVVNAYYSEVSRACGDHANKSEYMTIVANSDGLPAQERALLRLLVSNGVDGIIIADSDNEYEEQFLSSLGVPLVLMNTWAESPNVVARIETDFAGGARDATQHLLNKGHTQIAFLCGARETVTSQLRYDGYLAAMAAAGVAADPSLALFGTYEYEFGHWATSELIRNHAFTAVVCESDMLAMGAIQALSQAGRDVPGDCAVVGFDDCYLATMLQKPLTTVARSTTQSTQMAVTALVEHLEGKPTMDPRVTIETKLIPRATS